MHSASQICSVCVYGVESFPYQSQHLDLFYECICCFVGLSCVCKGAALCFRYSELRTNLPREIMSFSDFPFTVEALGAYSVDPRRFPRHEEVKTCSIL